jgi:uncharacterized protein YoxC
MEITSFALGMLVMVAIALVVVVVVGMFKVSKMKETMNNIERFLENTTKDLHDRISREVDEIQKDMTKNSFETDKVFKNFESHIESISDDKDRQITELNRYVDSRFDKLINTLNK